MCNQGNSATWLQNVQGRARPSLAQLYNWRYKELGDLPNVRESPEYKRANPGFSYDYQFVDVGDMNGQGESEPIPYFYQVPLHFPIFLSLRPLLESIPHTCLWPMSHSLKCARKIWSKYMIKLFL